MAEEPKHRRKLLFVAMTLVISVAIVGLAAELMVRLLVPAETFWPVSNIYQPSDVPGLIYTYKPNFEGVAFGVDLKTNRLGFRGDEWTQDKTPGMFRIVLIGDSHAFGFGVPSQDIMPRVLTGLLEDRFGVATEVLNFGVNGYTGSQQLAALKHLALDYSPDLVLLLPANNDHKPSLRADREGWLHWDGEGNNEKSRIVDRAIQQVEASEVSWWMDKSRLVLYLKLMEKRRRFNSRAQSHRQTMVGLSADIEDDLLGPPEEWMGSFPPGPVSSRLRESVYPSLVELLDHAEGLDLPVVVASFCDSTDYRQMFQALEQERGLPVLEVFGLFPESTNWDEMVGQFGLGWDNHFNALAHRRLAVAIDTLIAERDVFSEALVED